MSKSTKPHNEDQNRNQSKLPDFVGDDVDDLLGEIQEYLRTASLANLKSVSNRENALQELARMLQRFTNTFNNQIKKTGNETVLDGLAERLLGNSDLEAFELSIANIGTPTGKTKLDNYLGQLPFPHYEANPADATTVVQILEDGTRTIGKFVDRKFVAVDQ